MADATVKLATSTNEEKRSKFRELGAKRINNALKAISLIGNLSNRASYEYSEHDIKKMIASLQDAVDTTEARFAPAAKGQGGFAF